MRYSTILISTFAALSLSLTINQTVHTEEIETAKWTETKWANVNRITFQDEFSSFNSGVAKLRKGQTATIKAKIDYSGDLHLYYNQLLHLRMLIPLCRLAMTRTL